ncbi:MULTISPECIES: pyridoxamine 5'-phosphate oxidase family protein [unclassified Nocardioides]|uniref:pyridoxamine 5'-phosphate oxidase family protein n=1 Tax=unclassified Nocardioides TaxID=2615069 RepID=UPI003617BCE2
MTLSATDLELLELMKQREFSLKKRVRAAHAISHELSRFRRVFRVSTALVAGALLTCFIVSTSTTFDRSDIENHAIVTFVFSTLFGWLLAAGWLLTPRGQRIVDWQETRLHEKYSGDLHAGRRWQQFFYRGEEISAYVGQILYLIESEGRFDSIDEALAFARANSREPTPFRQRALEQFDSVAAGTTLIVVSTIDAAGQPSSRLMRFVKSERRGVWYFTTAPETPKVSELDQGRLALVTSPTDSGATISSNNVRVRRADVTFPEIADLYRAQAPHYLEGMTDDDQRQELVYELTFESAKVSDWVDQQLVVFDDDRASRAEA